jgi:uncharacterized phage-associated protein
LAIFNTPLFTDEIEAWVHGPVVRSVYDVYRQFKWTPINTETQPSEEIRQQFSSDQQDILDDIVEIYFPDTAYALEQLTRSEDPWIFARTGLAPYEASTNVITWEAMKAYYARKLKKAS